MKSPELYTLEHGDGKKNDHIERKLSPIEESDGSDKNEKLKLAQEALVGNNDLYEQFLKATLQKDTDRNVSALARIEGFFISKTQDLSESDIESVVRQFNKGFRDFVSTYRGEISISSEQKRKIFENDLKYGTHEIKGKIYSDGIINVIRFLQARKKMLGAEPAQEQRLYTNDILDARYKIDLIECLLDHGENGELVIKMMNLIQIKSSEPSEKEQNDIVQAHRDWIHSSVMDFDAFEHEYKDGLPGSLPAERLTENGQEVEELLLDLSTDPEGFNPDLFIQKLDLDKLTNKQKAWVLTKCSENLKQNIRDAVTHGSINKSDADLVMKQLTELEEKMRHKAKLPKNLSFVDSIHSIIAVGPKIIKNVELTSPKTKQTHRKVVKYN